MKKIFKRGMSGLLAVLMALTVLAGFGTTTAFAASETAESYMISFPRDGDAAQIYSEDAWGHSAKNYMNGWATGSSNYTTLHCMDSFDGKVCYCIEPGLSRNVGDTYHGFGEDFWDNYPSQYNNTIEPDDIKLLLGRIMQYGYQGNLSTSWRSQNDSDADKLAHAFATQLLVWETVVGERDADFDHVSTGGYDEILSLVSPNHPLYSRIITITVAKKDIEEARAYFARIGADLTAHFANLGSKCVPLNAVERLRILHDFYRPGDEAAFSFDMNRKARLGHDFRDYICPDSIERAVDHIKLGEKYARVLFLKDYASYIKDSMFSELTELNRNLMLSIDVIPIPTDEAVREVERLLLGVETNITGWQRRQNQNNNFSAVVPYDMELQRKESKEFLDDLTTRDQRMMFAVVTMVITADTKEQLDLDTETVLSTARKHMCQMATLKYQQTDGLNTVLPIGTRKINAFRTLTTESLAVLMPFKVQEIMDKGGIYFGENAISHNLIMCNKANLLNQSAFLLGVPGSGKSFSAKELITFLILNTNDDIMICDPEGEYAPLIEAMGDLGSVIRVSAGGRDRLNAMYMVDGYGENNPIVVKSEFIMSLIEQIDKKGVGPQHKSIIDRCITNVYRNAADTGTIPTLCTLRDMLLEQPEPEAKQIALSLELYTTGSLDIFGKQSNVDLDKRVVVFDIHGLGSQLKPTGLLVITDTMLNRVTLNWKKGKRTHVFIDEFHVVFENEFSAQFFNSAWRQFRKRNAYPTAITQNVEYLLDSVQASTMLSNSEFVVMLNQAASDRGQLAKLLNISNEQMSYITNADAGCGLIKYGSALVPFINRFPQDTKLYQLMTTRPGEGKFARGRD